MSLDPEMLTGLKELRQHRVENHSTEEHLALSRALINRLSGHFIRLGYGDGDYEPSYGQFDEAGIGHGEDLVSALHNDTTWIPAMRWRYTNA